MSELGDFIAQDFKEYVVVVVRPDPILGTPMVRREYDPDGTLVCCRAACIHTFIHSLTLRDN